MLTRNQKYAIASMLAGMSVEQVKQRLTANQAILGADTVRESLAYLESIEKYYKGKGREVGFVPRSVIKGIFG